VKSIILCSGGLDSTVLIYLVLKYFDHLPIILAYDYGQRNLEELDRLKKVCKRVGLEPRIQDIKNLFEESKSILLKKDVPLESKSIEDIREKTKVEGRNQILISLATKTGLIEGVDAIFFGGYGERIDADEDFCDSMTEAVNDSTGGKIRMISPFVQLEKSDVIKLGKFLDVPMHETWTCYDNKEKPCGKCVVCKYRKTSFEDADIADHTEYLE